MLLRRSEFAIDKDTNPPRPVHDHDLADPIARHMNTPINFPRPLLVSDLNLNQLLQLAAPYDQGDAGNFGVRRDGEPIDVGFWRWWSFADDQVNGRSLWDLGEGRRLLTDDSA